MYLENSKKNKLINCVGGGSSAMGFWNEFMDYIQNKLNLLVLKQVDLKIVNYMPLHLLTMLKLEFCMELNNMLMQDKEGQISETESISAGLDYPGSSPLHCFLKDAKRARYTSATDEEH